jgi:motility quorum-sensing regulator/GCU-specific mRNA interferase toxin
MSATRSALTARRSIFFELGWELEDALKLVWALTRKNFYKSMTTIRNHKVWQDVYHAKWRDIEIYLKFQQYEDVYYFTVSFKEK